MHVWVGCKDDYDVLIYGIAKEAGYFYIPVGLLMILWFTCCHGYDLKSLNLAAASVLIRLNFLI